MIYKRHIYNAIEENKPFVSVIMSVYNTKELYLRKAINSVLKQTYTNFEFIIFNDASDAHTCNVLNEYLKDNRVILINNLSNYGLTYNLNQGLILAKGKYIARMDSDDICEITRFYEQVNFLEANKDYAMVGTYFTFFTSTKEYNNICDATDSEAIKSSLFFGNSCLMHSSVMLRASVFNSNHYTYNLRFKKSQDYELWSRISHCHKIGIIPKFLMKYRLSDNQISSKFASEQLYYKNIVLIRQLSSLVSKFTEEEKLAHIALCNRDKVSSVKFLYVWCMKVEKINNENTVFEKRSFSFFLSKHLLITSLKSIRSLRDFPFVFLTVYKYLNAKFKFYLSITRRI